MSPPLGSFAPPFPWGRAPLFGKHCIGQTNNRITNVFSSLVSSFQENLDLKVPAIFITEEYLHLSRVTSLAISLNLKKQHLNEDQRRNTT